MQPHPLLLITTLALSFAAAPGQAEEASLVPAGLRTEYTVDPLGIDAAAPRLSWRLVAANADGQGQQQTAWQVLVASQPGLLAPDKADLWDSGRRKGPRQLNIPYEGAPLHSGQRACWTVRAWDEAGRPSSFAPTAWFEMALMSPDDWQGAWIGKPAPPAENEYELYGERPAPLLRKGFALDRPIRSARAYVTGLGYYELRLNGEKVGDHELDPGWTDYRDRVYYSTYDVTRQLREGANAVGITLGNGWYDPLPLRMWGWLNLREHLPIGTPRALLQLVITHEDGTVTHVVTGDDWRCADGPIRKNDVYTGELHDARLAQAGWDEPGFDDGGWEPVHVLEAPGGRLEAQPVPPIRVTETIAPVSIATVGEGTFVADMGVNFAGRVRFTCEGAAGTTVRLRYGELLHEDGTVNANTAACGQIKRRQVPEGSLAPSNAFQEDTFILGGTGRETFVPKFTFHGFRYVQIMGLDKAPATDDLVGERLRTDVDRAGSFACSSDLLNRVQAMTVRTIESNLHSVQSDCPTREKFGYGGDIVACGDACIYNFDMARFYTKAVRDLGDAQRPSGAFTETAPYVGISYGDLAENAAPVGWGTAHPMLLQRLLRAYGEERLLREQLAAAQRWLDLLLQRADNYLLDNGIGDHESLVEKDTAVSGTGFVAQNIALVSELEAAIGATPPARRADQLAALRARFGEAFLDGESGRVGNGSQASQLFALQPPLLPEDQRIFDALVTDIESHGGKLTTGIFGTSYLLETLTRHGRADLAYAIALNREFPGWGHMLDNGATTLWEHWAFSDDTFSHDHPMFGSISTWLYRCVAGIDSVDAVAGTVTIAPYPGGGLTWAKASYASVYGPIESEWRIEEDGFTLRIKVPIGMTATVRLPESVPGMKAKDYTCAARRATPGERMEVGPGAWVFTAVSP